MPGRLRNLRVLVVDDNPVHGEATALLLRRNGNEAEWSANGQDALARLRVFRPDVIVLDCRLPDMSGLQLWRRVEADPELAGVAAVGFTAATDAEAGEMESAGVPVVRKPADPSTLERVISEAAGGA